MDEWKQTNWWMYMDGTMQDLIAESYDLLVVEKQRAAEGKPAYLDYGFVVFPAAKAYEGFLKKLFLDLGLITKQQFLSDHFRIGRAMSPTLPKRYRIGWVWGRLLDYCKGDELPMELWETWKMARNRTFHYFPQYKGGITLLEAEQLVSKITQVMAAALAGCRVAV